jgi:hypothetical protein
MIEWSLDINGAKSFVSPESNSASHNRANRNSDAIAAVSAGLIQSPQLARAILQLSSIVARLLEVSAIFRANSDHWGEIVACGRVWKAAYEKTGLDFIFIYSGL